jgi:hypothetical protein
VGLGAFFLLDFCCWVRFSSREFQKDHMNKTPLGGSPCQKLLAEKVEKNKLFACRISPSIFLTRFLAVSLHEEPQNAIK